MFVHEIDISKMRSCKNTQNSSMLIEERNFYICFNFVAGEKHLGVIDIQKQQKCPIFVMAKFFVGCHCST
jgi:hypothetical protein